MTEQQNKIIAKCIEDGFGTAQFALSVKRSGRCTEKQLQTMLRLHSAAEFRRRNYRRKVYPPIEAAYGEHEATFSDM